MKAVAAAANGSAVEGTELRTLVWIDSREAKIVRWNGHEVSIERIESSVPDHRKATGIIRRQPHYEAGLMSGGYGHPHLSDESHRLEHLARYIDRIAGGLKGLEPLHILGPGPVRERLERAVMEADAHDRRVRPVSSDATPRLTDRQLVARLRALAGDTPSRQAVGRHRWTGEMARRASGAATQAPQRAARKPSGRRAGVEAAELAAEVEAATAEP
jgi:hypothetical protein